MALHSTVSLDYISDLSSSVCSYELVPPYCSVSNPMSPLTPDLRRVFKYSFGSPQYNGLKSLITSPHLTFVLYTISI